MFKNEYFLIYSNIYILLTIYYVKMMSMKMFFLKIITFMLILSSFVMADSDHGDFSEAKELLEQRLSYDQLSDDQFELLGDYFMDIMTGEDHEFMDDMMGGEGSESLRQMHIEIGQNFYNEYLVTGTIRSRGMHGLMMTDSNSDWGHMMYPGTGHVFWGFGFFGVILMAAFWLFVIWGAYWIIQQLSPKKKSKTPIEILKERLAKGEITKKQFDETKRKLLR